MNRLLVPAILAACCSIAQAQVLKEGDVPAVVQAKFSSLFKVKANVKWEKEKSSYEATFKQDKMEVSVLFDVTGGILQTEKEILISALPKAVSEYVIRNMGNKKITEAAEITDAQGRITYEAEVEKTDYLFDEKGKFIDKEIDTEEGSDDDIKDDGM